MSIASTDASAALDDAADDGREQIGHDDGIAVVGAEAREHQAGHVLQEQVLHHREDRDLLQLLHRLLAPRPNGAKP